MRRITLLTNPDVCNLKCPLCFLRQRGCAFGMGEMPFEIVERAIGKYGDGLEEVIPSTMGEPLLYSQFGRLLDFCRARGVPLNLTTNGTFPGVWGEPPFMKSLLQGCSDIKISALSFESETYLQGKKFEESAWKKNVESLLECGRSLSECGTESGRKGDRAFATVSLQVTLHRKNVSRAEEILRWAESVGVHRIKWNPVVFLSVASPRLEAEYGLEKFDLEKLRERLVSTKLKCGGSLFFENKIAGCGTSDKNRHPGCPFHDEVWVLPDGSEQSCPNPERRFGNPRSPLAGCDGCVMARGFPGGCSSR